MGLGRQFRSFDFPLINLKYSFDMHVDTQDGSKLILRVPKKKVEDRDFGTFGI